MGLDPARDFLQDQADALASYINGWVRRLYDAQDWPEWTKTIGFEADPVTHLVSYLLHLDSHTVDGGLTETIGRVFKVYLLDPAKTFEPFETPFRLTPNGIFVGFEHGPTVWIKYIPACPQFTSTPWDPDFNYAKGDVVYLPITGECYKSKTNNNRGHDPAGAGFNQNPPPIVTEITQERTPDDPGLVEQNEIYLIDFDKFNATQPIPSDTFHVPDPPAANDSFYIDIVDENGTFIGEAGPHLANGVETVADIMGILAVLLQADLGGTFVVTAGPKSVTVENSSMFHTAHAFYLPVLGSPHYFPIPMVIQSYIPATTGAQGQPQKTIMTMSSDQMSTGTTYSISFRGPDGAEHTVEYVAAVGDSVTQILAGLTTAIEAARVTDDYFNEVSPSLDPTLLTLTLTTRDVASIDAAISAPGSPFWGLQLFPMALADPVIRGEVADVIREEGETDRADAEEQKVQTETGVSAAKFTTLQFLPLTDQQKPKSRYSVK